MWLLTSSSMVDAHFCCLTMHEELNSLQIKNDPSLLVIGNYITIKFEETIDLVPQ